ncbi:MAG: winged helix-turn-helix domain-containing protein [Candidatus Woesearchaeota archaeon]
MIRKRDRIKIIHDILRTVQERNGLAGPTHILYKSNLSYRMLETYLKDLMDGGFISEKKAREGKTYSLEPRGFLFLEKYKQISEFFEMFGI